MGLPAGKKIFPVTLAVLASAVSVYAGNYSSSSVGTSSGKFLSFGVSARAAAMGEAYSAVAQDADTVRYNPAAMVRVETNSAELMHANYIAGTFLEHLAFVHRLGDNQAIGLSALQMSYGTIAETDETGYQTGSAHPSNLALTAAYSCKLESLGGSAIGLSASYVQSTIVSSAKTFTASLGLLSPVYGPYEAQLALVAENLIGSLKFDQQADPLPMTFKLGGVLHLHPEWVLALDLVGSRDNSPYAAVGVEKLFRTQSETKFAIRGGYNMRSAKDIGGLAGFATGLGVSFNSIALDYALTPFGDLGYTHKLTLGFKFGKDRGETSQEKRDRPAYRAAKPVPEPEPLAVEPEPQTENTAVASPEIADKKTYQEYLESADTYISQKDYGNAAKEYNNAQKILPGNDKRKIFTFEQQGQMALKLKNIPKAKSFYLAAIQTAKKLNVSDTKLVNSYLGLAYCFEKSGNIPTAIKNYEKGMSLSNNEKTKARIKNLLYKLKKQSTQ